MGVLYEKEFHYNDALIQYQNALNIKPDFLEGQVNLSIALRRDSKFKQALALLKQASEKNPSSPEAWLNLSVIYTDLGMKAEAGEARNLANSYRSNYHLSEFDQGITFGTKEMYDDGSVKPVKNANPKYKYTLEVKTDHDAVALENINTKVSRRQSGGIDTFDERFAAGERYFAQGKYNNAISEYRQAIKLRGAKTFPEAYEKIGICFSNLGEFKDCIEFLKIAAKQDPKSSSILVNLSKAYGVQKNYEKQIEILTQLLEVDKDFNDTYYLLGMAYIRLKQSSNAVKALKTYLKKSPNTLKKSFVERLIKQHSK
jgi:tetratricopeptide (TPR) repeat protein